MTCICRLPPELERIILILAMKNFKNNFRFLLVNKCAYEWLVVYPLMVAIDQDLNQ